MKLTVLNLWGGRISNKLEEFFKSNSAIDIWCFQEVFKHSDEVTVKQMANVHGYEPNLNLFDHLHGYLPNSHGEFCVTFEATYGMATFLKPGITILDKGCILVAKGDWGENSDPEVNDHDRRLQWLKILIDDKPVLLANTHLTHRPEGKKDVRSVWDSLKVL
jgi:hypothetical protein